MKEDYKLVVFSALAIVLLNGLALLFCKIANKNDAERYFLHFEPLKYVAMKMCYTILILSLTYNARYLLTHVQDLVRIVKSFRP